jgi:dihydroorotate dehydrogenase (fumarate)
VSVKLSAHYANPLALVRALDEAGAEGFVLFNRFLQPDIDVETERNLLRHLLSDETDQGLALRYTGLLAGRIRSDICSSSGIMQAADAVKMLLAGAACVQVVSSLYKNEISHLSRLRRELAGWMAARGYTELGDFRGKLSAANNPDPWAYRRAQYVRLLLGRDKVLESYPSP